MEKNESYHNIHLSGEPVAHATIGQPTEIEESAQAEPVSLVLTMGVIVTAGVVAFRNALKNSK